MGRRRPRRPYYPRRRPYGGFGYPPLYWLSNPAPYTRPVIVQRPDSKIVVTKPDKAPIVLGGIIGALILGGAVLAGAAMISSAKRA